MVEIKQITYQELIELPGFDAAVSAYALECSMVEIGIAKQSAGTYAALSDAGKIQILAAVNNGRLIGFVTLIVSELPHYCGRMIAVTESFFVASDDRKSGAGAKLIKAAEKVAKGLGAVTFLVSAPAGSALERVAPLWGYRHSNTVFARAL